MTASPRRVSRDSRSRVRARRLTCLAAVLLTASCAPADRAREERSADSTTAAKANRPESGERDIGERAWTVSETGYGPVRAGMTVAEARAVLGASLESPREPECDHITWLSRKAGAQPSALLMVVKGQIARVEVNDTSIITSVGVRVGDSEERVRTLYSGRVRVEPHKYSDGRYLIVPAGTGADSVMRLVFETEKGRVTRFRSGRYPEVQWVEGCS